MGDMTQPAHVRADSHSAYEPVEKTVNGEMIKKIIGDAHKNANFKPVDEFVIEKGLLPDQLMQKVAAFTNANFFSNDTIFDYEIWTFPRNHKKPYPSPQLSRLTQVKGVYYARFTPVGWVPLAKETGSVFAMVLNDSDKYGRKHPKFHALPGMAEAQAKVLIPLAVYNCAELINDFIPSFRLDVSLKNINGNTYCGSGELLHLIENDPVWAETGAIHYTGPGYFVVNDARTVKCEFVAGKLQNSELTLDSGDTVKLVVRAGGLIVSSEQIFLP
ncbi:MAG: hypothetical protein EOM50_10930 [Erysipelotrichia bacterium]|nr:hypothetical protein [Erysipelotrichia bacterium]